MTKSSKPRKQRREIIKGGFHRSKREMRAHLSKTLREKYKKRSFTIKIDDGVKIIRGGFKGKDGKVERVNLRTKKIFIDGIQKSKDEQIINILKNGIQKEDVPNVREYIIQAGGIQYAEQQVKEYIQKAQRCLETYPDSKYKESLIKLTSFMTTRKS